MQSCVMVTSVGLTVTTAGRMDPGHFFHLSPLKPTVLALNDGREVGLLVRQRWPGEVWVWPLEGVPLGN